MHLLSSGLAQFLHPDSALAAGAYYKELALAGTFFVAGTFVYLFGHVIFALVRDIRIQEFGMFFGPPLARFKLGGVAVRINVLPLGGYVRFATSSSLAVDRFPVHVGRGRRYYDEVPRLEHVALLMSAPVATIALCVVLMGPADAWRTFAASFGEFVRGAIDPARARADVNWFLQLIRDGHHAQAAGVVILANTMINLLPAPIMTGGMIIFEVASLLAGRPVPDKVMLASLPLAVVLVVGVVIWAVALLTVVKGHP